MSDEASRAESDNRSPDCTACDAQAAFDKVTQLTMQYERASTPLTLPMYAYLTGMAAGALAVIGRRRGRLCSKHSLDGST